MSKRLVLPILALALVAAACSEPPVGEIDFGSGRQFVPEVADSIDNVGIGAAVAFDADGVPFVSYWGFPAVLAKGADRGRRARSARRSCPASCWSARRRACGTAAPPPCTRTRRRA